MIVRVEDEHETVDVLLDRLKERHPVVDESTFRQLDRHLSSNLTTLYDQIYQAADPSTRWRLRPLKQRPREWNALLEPLRRAPHGTERWWLRLQDLEHRVRRHFNEVENEILDLADSFRFRS